MALLIFVIIITKLSRNEFGKAVQVQFGKRSYQTLKVYTSLFISQYASL